ncbi:MAG: hypothetical protein QXT08_01425, partial [Thermoproteota archaeon]
LERLGSMVKQDAYGRYVLSDDAREVLRFAQLVEQMSMTKPVGFWKNKILKILSLALIVVLLSATIILELYQVVSRQIPLYENLDLSEGFVTVEGIKFRYLLVTTNMLENGTKIVFRRVTFTYLASTVLRLHECFYSNPPVSEVGSVLRRS